MIRKIVFDTYYNELLAILKDAAAHGAECYLYSEKDTYPNCGNLWGYILTENKNIISIHRDSSFDFLGWTFTFSYQQSREHGTGCQCFKEPLVNVTYEDILQAEQEGLVFARRLGAKLHTDTRKALTQVYSLKKMERIMPD